MTDRLRARLLGIALATVASAGLLLAACQADISVTVDEERQLTMVTTVGFSDSLAQLAGDSLGDLFGEGFGDLGADGEQSEGGLGDADGAEGMFGMLPGLDELGEDVEVTSYSEGGYSGYRVTLILQGDEVSSRLNELGGLVGVADVVPSFDFRRTDADDGWVVGGQFAFGSVLEGAAGDLGGGMLGGMFGSVMDQFDFTLKIILPGEVVESNAHSVVNGAQVWDLMAEDGVDVQLVSQDIMPFPLVPWLFAGFAIGLLVAIAIWQVVARRKARASEPVSQPSQAPSSLNIDPASDS